MRLLEVGVHSVSLAATLEETLEQERVNQGKHERVGGRNRESRTARGEGDHDARGQHKEEGSENKDLGEHFYV